MEQRYANATIIFRAWMTSADRPDPSRSYDTTHHLDPSDYLIAQFEVIEKFKGDPEDIEFIYSRDNGGACGVPFEPGAEYVFFAAADGYVAICGGSFRHSHIALNDSRFRRLVDKVRALE